MGAWTTIPLILDDLLEAVQHASVGISTRSPGRLQLSVQLSVGVSGVRTAIVAHTLVLTTSKGYLAGHESAAGSTRQQRGGALTSPESRHRPASTCQLHRIGSVGSLTSETPAMAPGDPKRGQSSEPGGCGLFQRAGQLWAADRLTGHERVAKRQGGLFRSHLESLVLVSHWQLEMGENRVGV